MSTTTHRSKTRRRVRNWLLIPLGSIVALALIAGAVSDALVRMAAADSGNSCEGPLAGNGAG